MGEDKIMINIKKSVKDLLSLAILLPVLHMESLGSREDPMDAKAVGSLKDKMEGSIQNEKFLYDTIVTSTSSRDQVTEDQYRTSDRKRRRQSEFNTINKRRAKTSDLSYTHNSSAQNEDPNYNTPERCRIVGARLNGMKSSPLLAEDISLLPSYIQYEKY